MNYPEPHGLLQAAVGMPALLLIAVCGLSGCLHLALRLAAARREQAELRRSLQQAHDSEADLQGQLHALRHCAPDAVMTISGDGFIEGFNSAAEEMFGWPESEIVNCHFRELFPEPDGGDCYIHDFVMGSGNDLAGGMREISARRSDGSSFIAECNAARQGRSGRRGIIAIVRDLSEVRRHAQLLEQSELRLREAQQLARLGNMELQLADGRMYWSDELFHLFGLEAGSSEPDMRLYLSLIHPEDRDGLELAMDALIRQGSCHEQSYRLLPQAGRQAWHHARFIIDRNDSGKALRLLATVQDISSLRGVEETRRELEAKLNRIHKLETIGSVSSAIAHDFNNILTPIIGFTELSLAEAGDESVLHRNLQQVRRGATRASELVQRILSFSDSPVHEPSPVELHGLVREVLDLLSVRAGKRVELELAAAAEPLHVLGDATQLHQVMLNLCTNALHAIGTAAGRIAVQLEVTAVDLGMLETLPALKPGPHALISVSDDGAGIQAEQMERIFEPFFSSRSSEGGNGIGLSVVHGIVLAHGGEIRVESLPGQGSCFRVYLPLSRNAPAPEPVEPRQDQRRIPGGHERILIVDDEPDISSFLEQMLARLGYEVQVCRYAEDAIELLDAGDRQFDLLISDLTMPRMDGAEFVRHIRQIGVKLPVIMLTGFRAGLPRDIIEELGIGLVLQKPLVREELALAIRQALGNVETLKANDKDPVGR